MSKFINLPLFFSSLVETGLIGFLSLKIIQVAYNCQKELRELFITVVLWGFWDVRIPGRAFQNRKETD